MKIRILGPSDLDAFRALRLLGLELHPDCYATPAESWRQASDDAVRNLLEASAALDHGLILGLFEGQDLRAQVGLKRDSRGPALHKSTAWGLIVHPEHRGRGLATSLILELLAQAPKIKGLRQIRAMVTAHKHDALHVLKKLDFKEYGREPDSIHHGSQFFDQVYLWRRL